MISRTLGGWLALVAGAALAFAAATVPQLWVQYALPGDTKPRAAGPVVIDAPLTFTADAAGRMHLGVSLPLVGLLASGCTADAAGNLQCPKISFTPPAVPAQALFATDEVPNPGTAPGTWTLAHAPADPSHAVCSVDGVVQSSGFSFAGNLLIASWNPAQSIKCTYAYLP